MIWHRLLSKGKSALLLALGLLLLGAAASAQPLLPGGQLQGEATMRYFGLRIYHARLWALPDFTAARATDQPVVLELEYFRDLEGKAIAERSLKEMQRSGQGIDPNAQRWLNEMTRIFPDVKAGDRLAARRVPGEGASFWHNDRQIGQVNDDEFARLFFGIWLDPGTSEPDLRVALLGQTPGGGKK